MEVALLSVRREVAHGHVIDHPLAQGAGLVGGRNGIAKRGRGNRTPAERVSTTYVFDTAFDPAGGQNAVGVFPLLRGLWFCLQPFSERSAPISRHFSLRFLRDSAAPRPTHALDPSLTPILSTVGGSPCVIT